MRTSKTLTMLALAAVLAILASAPPAEAADGCVDCYHVPNLPDPDGEGSFSTWTCLALDSEGGWSYCDAYDGEKPCTLTFKCDPTRSEKEPDRAADQGNDAESGRLPACNSGATAAGKPAPVRYAS